MSTNAKPGVLNEDFEAIKKARNNATPENGSYVARCYALAIMGTIRESYKNAEPKPTSKICLGFELPGYTYLANDQKRPITAFIELTNSMGEKSNMYKLLKNWSNGETVKYKNRGDFDLAKMLSRPCLLQIEINENEKNDKFIKITGISSLPKEMNPPKQILSNVIFDVEEIDPNNFPLEEFEEFPYYIQNKIASSDEFISSGLTIEGIREGNSGGYSSEASDEGDSGSDKDW